MDTPQFKLRWNNHRETLIKVLNNLLLDGAYVDCTLAAEGRQISAHKIVLSACSSYLNDILQAHTNKHPVLILKDIRFSDLEAMVNYMYNGEVNVAQDNLNTFLKAAESLKLSGLSSNNDQNDQQLKRKQRLKHTAVKFPKLDESVKFKSDDTDNKPIVNENDIPSSNFPLEQLENFEKNFKEKYERNSRCNLGNITNSNNNETGVDKNKHENEKRSLYTNSMEGDGDEEEEDINYDDTSQPGPSEVKSLYDYTDDQNRCIRCEIKFPSKHDLMNHILYQCKPYKCEFCKKNFSQKQNLKQHVDVDCAKRPRYQCPYCTKKYSLKNYLDTHVKQTHTDMYDTYMTLVIPVAEV